MNISESETPKKKSFDILKSKGKKGARDESHISNNNVKKHSKIQSKMNVWGREKLKSPA